MNTLRFNLLLVSYGLFFGSPLVIEAQSKPDKRLLQKISIKVEKHSVEELLKDLGKKYKLPVDFDSSVAAEALGKEHSFSLTADGLTLGSVIHLACESEQLGFSIEKGRLLVKSQTAESEKLVVHEYSLASLDGLIDPQLLAISLEGLTSGFWKQVDGEGGEFVEITPQSMTIRQSRSVHAELQSLFDQISAAVTGHARALSVQERADQAIVRKLETPTQFAGEQTSLPELLGQLLRKNGVSFWIDEKALMDEGIDWTKLNSTIEARKTPTAARLDAIVAEHQLSWRVADEVVQITTAKKSDEQMVNRVYDISRSNAPNRPAALVMQQLVSNKDLGPWTSSDDEGGSIMHFGTFLVIRQNAKTQAKIAKLLN